MFSTLPVELVEHILSFLDFNDKKTCAAICRVSRALHELAMPLLYRSIGICDLDLESAERFRRLQLLLRTMSRNLPLTQHVEEVIHFIEEGSTEDRPIEVDLELEAIEDLVRRDLDLATDIFEYLEINEDTISEEYCLLTLLTICPKAKTLHLKGNLRDLWHWYGFDDIVHGIRAAEGADLTLHSQEQCNVALQNTTSFHKIRTVQLESTSELQVSVLHIESLLWLPKLQRLHTNTFDQISSLDSHHEGVTFRSRVETLEITDCFAKPEDLSELLRECVGLRSLLIEWPSREDNYRRFDWADLGDSIRESCPSLEQVHLEHPRDFMLDDDDFRNITGDLNDEYLQNCHLPGLGSMRDLVHLNSLHVSSIALFGTHRDDSFVPAGDFSDSDDGNEVKHCLESVTPDSLKELVVYCERPGLRPVDIAILHEPGAERLERLTIVDCQTDGWVARKHGHLSASNPTLLARISP